jgi:tetratricopeptide (TPR) repeat protein
MVRIIILLIFINFSVYGSEKEIDRKITEAWKYYEQGRFIKMEKISKEILKESLKLRYQKGIAEGYYYLGVAYYSMGNMSRALEYANKAVEYSEKHTNYRWKAYAYTLAGEILRSLRKYDEAMKNFEMVLQIIKKYKNKKMLPAAYSNIGNIYFEKGEYKKASEFYKKGLTAGKEIRIRESYIALNSYNLGLSYYKQKKFSEAVKYLTDAYKIYKKLGDKKSIVSSAFYTAKSYIKTGEYRKAYKILKENYKTAKEVRASRMFFRTLKKLEDKIGSF